jgi:hypothetical protein
MNEIKEKIVKFIQNSEYKNYIENRLGGGLSCHTEGLPPFEVIMQTDNQVLADGLTRVFITETKVFKAYISFPLNYQNWRVVESFQYESPECLLDYLTNFCKKPANCWS